jgi:hypothetical protein
MEWTLYMLREHNTVPYRDELLAAGEAMKEWLDLVRVGPLRVSPREHQRLNDYMVKALLHCENALVSEVPKHHMFAHATHRAGFQGNPKYYSTFLDEFEFGAQNCCGLRPSISSDCQMYKNAELAGCFGPLDIHLWSIV